MPRPGPVRRNVPLKLSEAELAPVQAVAQSRHAGNLSAAIRALLVQALTADSLPKPVVPVFVEPTANTITISDAGAARLQQLADRDGCTRDEIIRRVLKYGAWKMPPGYKG